MRKTIKALLLAALTIGVVAGCEWGKTSESSSQETSSQSTSDVTSSDSKESTSSSVPSSTTTTSSLTTSSTSSSSTTSSTISIPPSLTGITLNTTNVKKSYNYGDKLNLAGLVVTASYSDSTTKAVTDYTTYPTNDSTLMQLGEVSVRVDYQNFSESFKVTVNIKIP